MHGCCFTSDAEQPWQLGAVPQWCNRTFVCVHCGRHSPGSASRFWCRPAGVLLHSKLKSENLKRLVLSTFSFFSNGCTKLIRFSFFINVCRETYITSLFVWAPGGPPPEICAAAPHPPLSARRSCARSGARRAGWCPESHPCRVRSRPSRTSASGWRPGCAPGVARGDAAPRSRSFA